MDKLTDDVDLQNFSSQCYLLDLHSNNPSPSTYIGSSNRWIDHMFGCRKISDSMTSSGSLSYLEGPQSDHRGLFVDLNPLILMRDAIAPMSIAAYHTRMLKAGNPELVELYQSSMKKYDKEHNMTERLDALHKNRQKMSPTAIRILLEKWDSDQGRAMKQAEKQLSRPQKPFEWSPELRNAGLIYRYWKMRLSEAISNTDFSSTCIPTHTTTNSPPRHIIQTPTTRNFSHARGNQNSHQSGREAVEEMSKGLPRPKVQLLSGPLGEVCKRREPLHPSGIQKKISHR